MILYSLIPISTQSFDCLDTPQVSFVGGATKPKNLRFKACFPVASHRLCFAPCVLA